VDIARPSPLEIFVIGTKTMKAIEYLDLLTKKATKYRTRAEHSIQINQHMNNLKDGVNIDQDVIDAVLTDFINYVGMETGVDYALYTTDLKKE
jgi:hypothetical protein